VGGSYAFAGGKVEKQDMRERWEPYKHRLFRDGIALDLPDFHLRITALRELFEECNILLAKGPKPTQQEKSTALLDDFTASYEGDFAGFCEDHS